MSKDPVHPLARKRGDGDEAPKPKPKPKTAGKTAKKKAARPSATGKPGGRVGKKRPAGKHTGPPPGKVRIQKVLAEAGLASRRACEEIVAEHRVRVNGEVVGKLPCFVDPAADKVTVDGRAIRLASEKKLYVLLNKAKGVVCTNSDPAGRPRAIDCVPEITERLYCVGRLDADSTGVILLTNDGELANRVSHPRYGLAKTYVVAVDGAVGAEAMAKIKTGVYLDGQRTARAGVKVLKRGKLRTLLEIRLMEGRNREIRRMLARMGHRVRSLRRTAIGPVTDRGVKTGNHRRLTAQEIKALRVETGLES